MDLTFTDIQQLLRKGLEYLTADVCSLDKQSTALTWEEDFRSSLPKKIGGSGGHTPLLQEAASGLAGSAMGLAAFPLDRHGHATAICGCGAGILRDVFFKASLG